MVQKMVYMWEWIGEQLSYSLFLKRVSCQWTGSISHFGSND